MFVHEKTVWKNVRLSERGHLLLVKLKRRMQATSYSEVIENLVEIYIKYEILKQKFPEIALQVDSIFEVRLMEAQKARTAQTAQAQNTPASPTPTS